MKSIEDSITELSSGFKMISEEEHQRRLNAEDARKQIDHNTRVAVIMSKTNLPKRHSSATIEFDGEWGSTYHKLLKSLTTGFLCALVGTRGNGKTQIGVQLIKANANRLKTSRFCCATEFFMDIKATYGKVDKSEKDVIKDYLKPDLLVIDEIGQRSDTEWENRLLFHLINQRYEDSKDTLIIANLEPEQLMSALGPSIASRMNETGGIINCTWPSFR